MTKKILKAILVLALIISSVCIFSGCGSDNKNNNENQNEEISRDVYEAPLRNYMEGLRTKDITLILQAYPEFMQTITQDDLDSIYAKYEAMYGSNIIMEYKIGDSVQIKDQQDLDVLGSQIKEYYPDAGDIKVTAAYIITVELSISGEGTPEQQENNTEGEENVPSKKTDSQDFYVYQYNGNWYMF